MYSWARLNYGSDCCLSVGVNIGFRSPFRAGRVLFNILTMKVSAGLGLIFRSILLKSYLMVCGNESVATGNAESINKNNILV